MPLLERNVSGQTIRVLAYNSATGALVTGNAANITAVITLDGGTPAASNDTNPTELNATTKPGKYEFTLTQAETNAQRKVELDAVSSTTDVVVITEGGAYYTIPPDFLDNGFVSIFDASTDAVIANMAQTLPGSPTPDTIGDALKRSSVALPLSTYGASGGLPLWDDVFNVVAAGTIATVTSAGDFTLDSGFSSVDSYYRYMFLVPKDGPAAKQPRVIAIYTGATRRCQFTGSGNQITRPYDVAPEVGDGVTIRGLAGTF